MSRLSGLAFSFLLATPLAAQQVDVVAVGATKISAAATALGRSKSIRAALSVTPHAKLVVHWWEPVDLATLVYKTPICGSRPDPDDIEPPPVRPFRADLLQCPDQKPGAGIGTVNPNQCTVVVKKELPLEARRGTIEWTGIAARLYFLRFAYPGLPDFHQAIEVATDATTTVDTSIRYYSFFGRVTEGTAPVHARVFGTVSDPETGRSWPC